MRVIVNTLSVTNQSGAHVLLGHLDGLVASLSPKCRFMLLSRASAAGLRTRLGDRVDWVTAPESTTQWFRRLHWERRHLAEVARQTGAQAYFTPNGISSSQLSIPQVVFCQNPWCMVPAARRKRDGPKAWLQRVGYRRAMREAHVMVFNSRYMQEAYRRNAGFNEPRSVVVYQAPGEDTRARAAASRGVTRSPGRIVCVSAMGPHKNVETVVRALGLLHAQWRTGASLHIIGGWPDPRYEKRIQGLVSALGLGGQVRFLGFVSREELDRHYAESQVFCLMSRCESFGLPSVEAQLFGTPVVSSNVCAIPEVCGAGGMYRDPDDAAGVAEALRLLLGSPSEWLRYSRLALENAARFEWPECTAPLLKVFEDLAAHA